MTAEIAVMNKEAVALAADSAVTISAAGGPKIFNSVSKIFGLSNKHPVGIMVYGGANLLGVPWETIIKSFRETLGGDQQTTLADYGESFISFIESKRSFFPPEAQQSWVASTVESYFRFIERRILAEIRQEMKATGTITRGAVKSIVSREVQTQHADWRNADDLSASLGGRADDVRSSYAKVIADARAKVFAQAPLSRTVSRQLGEIARWLFTKEAPRGRRHPGRSGLVIAGFGAEDVFPRLRHYEIDGLALGELVYSERAPTDVDRDNGAAIAPFAQREMVTTFIEGVHPNVEAAINAEFREITESYPLDVVDASGLSAADKKTLKGLFRAEAKKRANDAHANVRRHRMADHVRPVLNVVAVLPKDELAAMAESLVSLTSFRRRMSFAAETVGGPIDVAVISKGDGFIWINHKHYFTKELNPQFYANRYGAQNHGEQA
jgi:uncharacterized protein YwbE